MSFRLPGLAPLCRVRWRIILAAMLVALLAMLPGPVPLPAPADGGHAAHAGVASDAATHRHHEPAQATASPQPMPPADPDPRGCPTRTCMSACCILAADLTPDILAVCRQRAHLVHAVAGAPEPEGLGPEVAVPPPRAFS